MTFYIRFKKLKLVLIETFERKHHMFWLFLYFLVIMKSIFAFDQFDDSLVHHLKVEYMRQQAPNTVPTTMVANMTIESSHPFDGWLKYQFVNISSNIDDESLGKEFKAKTIRNKMVAFEDVVGASNMSQVIKQTVIKESSKNHKDIIALPYTEVENNNVTVEMPIGACAITNLNIKTEETGSIRTVTAKSKIQECVVSEDGRNKLGDFTITDDSYNEVVLVFDNERKRIVGEKSVIAAAADNIIESVFIQFV